MHELRVAARLIDRLAKRALFAEKQMVALEGRCKELWRQLNIVTHERDTLRKERDGLLIQVQDMRAEIERLKKPARQHPVAVGEYVKRLTGFNTTPAGEIGIVTRVDDDASEIEYEVSRPNGQKGVWRAKNCTPCDPPEATHDTPAGKEVAGSVIRDDRKTEPKPGVRAAFGLEWPLSCIEIVEDPK